MWRGAQAAPVHLLDSAGVPHPRADAVEPPALVRPLRRGERRAARFLGIETVAHLLRRVAAHRQRAGQGLGLEAVAEAGHVTGADAERIRRERRGRAEAAGIHGAGHRFLLGARSGRMPRTLARHSLYGYDSYA